MNRRWVVNASPLIVLAKISQIHLLSELSGDIIVPNGVVAEINVAPDDDPAKLWMVNEGARWIRDVEQVDPVIAAWDLGLGESHVLTWAYQHLGYQAILDDRAAKTAALALRIPVRGTLGQDLRNCHMRCAYHQTESSKGDVEKRHSLQVVRGLAGVVVELQGAIISV